MPPTRRQALSGTAALLVALAGCNSRSDAPTPDENDSDGSRFERPENVAMDPPTATLRRPGARDPIVEVPDAADRGETDRERRRAVERGFVTSSEAAALLRIDDVEGADDAREFVAETDFETRFLFVERGSVRQCYRQVLCYVTWTEFELRRTYAEVYRDYDVACSTDERDSVARFVRLDGSVDPRRIESGGTHVQRGGCPIPRWELDDRRATPTGTRAAPGDGTPADARTRATAASGTPVESRTADGEAELGRRER